MPKISIGLPCYNEADFIEATIRSVLAQTEGDFELIICDNASTDGTAEIISRAVGDDPRVLIRPNATNIGGAANFARALELASSPYFMWMGAHDLISKDYVKKLRLVLDADPECSLAYADSIFIAKNGDQIPGEPVETGVEAEDQCPVTRFKKLVWQLHRCDQFHGLMRREWVNPELLTACRGPDMLLLAAIVLRGRFRRLPELMFYRRHNRDQENATAMQKRLAEQGYVPPSQSMIDSWKVTRDAHLALLESSGLNPRDQRALKNAVCQVYLEKHCVPWDASETEANTWDRLQMRLADSGGQERIRERIRQRVAAEARIDNAATMSRMQRELITLLKENHRLRRELAKVSKKR
jgi:hypothetical protein